jgi:hypothetical protein
MKMENAIEIKKTNVMNTKTAVVLSVALGLIITVPLLPKLLNVSESSRVTQFIDHVASLEKGMEECSKKYGNHASCSLDKLKAEGFLLGDVAAQIATENPWGGIYQVTPFVDGWEIKATKLTSAEVCAETAAHYAGFLTVSAACSGTADLTVSVK